MQLAARTLRTHHQSFARTEVVKHHFAPATARATRAASGPCVVRTSHTLQPQSKSITLGSTISKSVGRLGIRTMATFSPEPVPAAGEELAVIGGGCFWCLEACYQQLKGVKKVVSGYAGGHQTNPTYEQVCNKGTGHAEVVGITYDPSQISFKDLLDVFFTIHDPTTPNRQGADVGPQYRSIILYANEEQKQTAEKAIAEVNAEKLYPNPVVTEVVPLTKFWPGEAYHQDYYKNNPSQGYCRMVVGPKVAKFRSKYMTKLMAPAL